MKPEDYYFLKLQEWQAKPPYFNYRQYVEDNAQSLSREFNSDRSKPRRDFNIVCNYLSNYAKGQESEAVTNIIKGFVDVEKDVVDILVGATIDACGLPKKGNPLIGIAVAGLIGAGLIALLASILSDKKK